jgi:ribonucleoside-diphosphate reductase alpha chain
MPHRQRLPARRASSTRTIFFGGEKYHLTIGKYENKTPGEVFLTRVKDANAAKLGTQLEAMCRDAAILISLALQYGVPINVIREAMTRGGEGEAQTIIAFVIDEMTQGGDETWNENSSSSARD